ncbi:MAG TPA: AAA family ATPase, partial [Thermodesulfobacteriota bacterium]|nr:AAA family ATPase [Thermodesulfobacteriota bacterium]
MMLSLRICEISVKDAGKGVARLDPKDMRTLGVNVWDLIEIGGKRKTVVRVMQLEKSLRGKSIVQVDGITRENARVGIDDRVFVRKVETEPGIKVVLAPLNSELLFNGDDNRYLLSRLEGVPITVGDRIRVTLPGARNEDFQVLGAIPAESVVICPTTKIELRRKPKGRVDASRVTYEDIGGLREQIAKVREMVELPLR